jgi:hypothetical protein
MTSKKIDTAGNQRQIESAAESKIGTRAGKYQCDVISRLFDRRIGSTVPEFRTGTE